MAAITKRQHDAARVIACPVCRAPVDSWCVGLDTRGVSHAARVHLFELASNPQPGDACDAALLVADGQRADALPFVAWLDGDHDFRTASARLAGALAMHVYQRGARVPVGTVRRAVLEVALRHGLIISTSDGGRGRWVTTERGRDYHAKHKRTAA